MSSWVILLGYYWVLEEAREVVDEMLEHRMVK
jgi:hypothetical protein